MAVLTEIGNTLDPNTFALPFLLKEQKETFQNYLCSLCEILLIKVRTIVDPELTNNILSLVKNMFQATQKCNYGGLLIFHALIIINEANIEPFIQDMGGYIVTAIRNYEDEGCSRYACGLISDLSNYLERGMNNYAAPFMECLNEVLTSSENFGADTKLHAMVAVGDICLAIEEQFDDYLDKTMDCLFSACNLTVAPPQNFESAETINKLRDSIIDAFISIIHGMQTAQKSSQNERRLQGYANRILMYLEELLANPNLETNEEFVRNLYELYIDIAEYYGQ